MYRGLQVLCKTSKYSLISKSHFQISTYLRKKSEEKIMRVLNVAEKNDAAKNISALLSGNHVNRREGKSKYNKIYEFDYVFQNRRCRMLMTSVSGHLLTHEFRGCYSKWNSCSPEVLFHAPVTKICPDEFQGIKTTLEREVRACDVLVIWTDCDREGENIGYEVISVCTTIKPTIQIYRAKFSEITRPSVKRAIENLDRPNQNISDAVEIRSELDLRIGAAFTRFQTLRLQRVFPNILSENVISYGSCQFPTLGFVVERYKQIQNFIPETFWKIRVNHTIKEINVEFLWKRNRLFDKEVVEMLFEKCQESPFATVEDVQTKPKSKWRPVPLDTVELEKVASRKLKINAKETMRIAERLYSQGYISYPRTETNIFPKELNLVSLVQHQTVDNRWGQFANKILECGPNPRQGKKSDQAHPPIHPTKHATSLNGNEWKVYEYIVRHFLACLSSDAKALETLVTIDVNSEKFVANGIMILELNYLEVYPYDKWNSKEIHEYKVGQRFTPTTMEIVEGQTSAPKLLTEADLISLMEKHGIGTDATHAEHIEKIKNRLYVGLEDGKYFVPGELGIGLVEGYDNMGLEMSKPHLRAELEADLKRICDGVKDPQMVLQEQIIKYKSVFEISVQQANKLDAALVKYFREEANVVANDCASLFDGNTMPQFVLKCRGCNSDMIVRDRPNSNPFISCTNYPTCRNAIWFPSNVLKLKRADTTCSICGPEVYELIFEFRPGTMAPFYSNIHKGCVNGCDVQLLEMLDINPTATRDRRNNIDREIHIRGNHNNDDDDDDNAWGRGRGDGNNGRNQWNNERRNNNNNNAQNNIRTVNEPPPFRFTSPVRNNGQFRNNNNNSYPPRRTFNNRVPSTGNDNDVVCNCGEPARRLTVMKETANKGRKFYTCCKGPSDQGKCDFFLWDDSQQDNTPAPAAMPRPQPFNNNFQNRRQPKPARGGRNTGGRKCGNCKQPGHTRNNCPNSR